MKKLSLILFCALLSLASFGFIGGGVTSSPDTAYHADNIDNGTGTNVFLNGTFNGSLLGNLGSTNAYFGATAMDLPPYTIDTTQTNFGSVSLNFAVSKFLAGHGVARAMGTLGFSSAGFSIDSLSVGGFSLSQSSVDTEISAVAGSAQQATNDLAAALAANVVWVTNSQPFSNLAITNSAPWPIADFHLFLICTNADANTGFVVGDKIDALAALDNSGNGDGCGCVVRGQNAVFFAGGSGLNQLTVSYPSGGDFAPSLPTSWSNFIFVWRFSKN